MISITTKCGCCKEEYTWTSQPNVLGKFPAGNILLSFAILCAGASVKKVLMVFHHMGLIVYHHPTYYYHQRHILVPTIVKFWRSYQGKILDSLKGKEVVIAGDGRHDSMGHSAKYGTYSIFCCTIGLIIHIELVQVLSVLRIIYTCTVHVYTYTDYIIYIWVFVNTWNREYLLEYNTKQKYKTKQENKKFGVYC